MEGRKIGFFGGCFNPPSNIHIELAKKVLQENNLDSVIFVPVGDFYQKEELLDFENRVNMLRLSIGKEEKLGIEDYEGKVKKKLYATDIFEALSEKYKNDDIYYIMGSDNFEKMPNWKNYEEIKDKYKYIVVKRDEQDISSTGIRNMIKAGDEKARDILNEDVYEHIKKYKLYRGE